MKIIQYLDSASSDVVMAGAKGAKVRIPVGVADGAPNFTMRVFTISPGGNTPYHRHDYEHEIFIIHGAGVLRLPDSEVPISEGTVLLISPDEWHGFVADPVKGMEMICLVPNRVYTGKTHVEMPAEPEAGPSGLC